MRVRPFERHTRTVMDEIEAEADRLVSFITGASGREIVIEPVS